MARKPHRHLLLAVLLPAALLLAACGGEAETGAPSAPASSPDSPSGVAWRTDLPVGANVNDVSFATPVLLSDGSTQTLEELAAGSPLLLYFYATW